MPPHCYRWLSCTSCHPLSWQYNFKLHLCALCCCNFQVFCNCYFMFTPFPIPLFFFMYLSQFLSGICCCNNQREKEDNESILCFFFVNLIKFWILKWTNLCFWLFINIFSSLPFIYKLIQRYISFSSSIFSNYCCDLEGILR